MPRPRPAPLPPLDEFRAFPDDLRAEAIFWLRHGFYCSLDLSERQQARLDGFMMRAETAGADVMASLRAEAGLPPTDTPQGIDLDTDLETEPC